jgi:CMP-N-acetylneuraminic acid synthetase
MNSSDMRGRSDGERVLAVVPARGGSVGIPRKNLATLGGMSLIARAAKVVAEVRSVTQAVLSTDDADMAEEGRRHGLGTPFMRPPELARADSSASDVLRHAWIESERSYQVRFDYALYLEPTSPLRLPADVEKSLQALIDSECDSAVTISPSPAHFTPHKCHMVGADGRLQFYLAEGRDISARQQIPPYYFRNGVAYALRREPFFRTGRIMGENTLAIVLDRPLVNIDEPFELELAEWLLSREERVER